MLGAYVCRQCRARLTRRIVPVRNPQWQPRATFFSLRNKNAQDRAEDTQTETQPQQEHAPEEKHNRPRIPESDDKELPRGRYSRLVDRVEDNKEPERPLAATYQNQVNADEYSQGPAAAIQGALNEGRLGRLDKAWPLFEDNYTSRDCEALTNPPEGDVEILANGRVFTDLLHRINGAFCNSKFPPPTTPSALLFKYEQLGLARPEHWTRQTLVYLTHKTIFAINTPTGPQNLPLLLSELLSVWRLFFQCKGAKANLESISQDWNLPAVDDMPQSYENRNFGLRLQEYHPKHVGNPSLGFCAAYFYTLSEALSTIETLRVEAEPFILFLGRVLAGASVVPVFKHLQIARDLKSLPKEVLDEITREIDTAPSNALAMLASQGATLGSSAASTPEANLEIWNLKRISRAVLSKQSAGVLNVLWEDIQRVYTKDGKPAIPRKIYNAFLSGYLIHLQPQRSVEVWNHMIAHGVQPDIESWVALLHGCERAQDLDGFNAMWTRMLNSGVEPDVYVWTTRVHGLIHLRQINAGLAALDEMGKRWLSAETAVNASRGKGAKKASQNTKVVNKHTKPSIEVINGAITALVQLDTRAIRHEKRVEYVQKLLGWAGNFSIKPDAITYNSLIQLYLRAGDYTTASRVLRQMESDGLAADAATHTMLISTSFSNGSFNNLSPTQQTTKVLGLLNDIEASGIKLNDHVYSTAIDRLLKNFSNHDAVRSIIDHMHERNMVPSAHVYTSLITYYFQQEPPPMQTIDSLVNQFFTSHRVPTDQVLFDRTIEGYASHDETGKMMSVLTRMSKHGTLPGWNALTVVVEALVRDGDYERARGIVRDVEKGSGVGHGGVLGSMAGAKRFFHVARQLGVGVEDEQMGDRFEMRGRRDEVGGMVDEFDMGDRAVRPGRNEKVLGEQLREQEIGQMMRREEAQDGLDPQMEQSVRFEKEFGAVPVADEEDVHGFLRDEHDDIHSRVNR
jgi:pentatricopeptide repeat protein